MINTISGDLGSGKTLRMLFLMQQAVKAGRPVFTNIELTDKCPFADKVVLIGTEEYPVCLDERPKGGGYQFFWEYLCDVKRAMIFIDEADIYFDSSDHMVFGRNIKIYHKHARKVKHDIFYCVQRLSNLYKRIKDLSGRYIVCEHNFRSMRYFRYIEMALGEAYALRLSRYLTAEFGDPNLRHMRGGGFFTYPEAAAMFPWYDTEEISADAMAIIRGEKVLERDARKLGTARGGKKGKTDAVGGDDTGAVADGRTGAGGGVASAVAEKAGPQVALASVDPRGFSSLLGVVETLTREDRSGTGSVEEIAAACRDALHGAGLSTDAPVPGFGRSA